MGHRRGRTCTYAPAQRSASLACEYSGHEGTLKSCKIAVFFLIPPASVGWSDLALFAIFKIEHIADNQGFF